MRPWLRLGLAVILAAAWAAPARAAVGSGAASAAAELGQEEGEPFSVAGYFKNFFTMILPPEEAGSAAPAAQAPFGLDSGGFRLKLVWHPAERYAVNLAYELNPELGGNAAFLNLAAPRPDPSAYRVWDLDSALYPAPGAAVSNFVLRQNLDRAYVSGAFGFGDLTLGRQPVAFGSARVINPTDVLAPFTYETLDKEERTGVDALRFRTPLGAMGEIDAGWVPGRDGRADRSAFFLKPKVYIWETDLTALVMDFRNNILVGLDAARAVGGASVWLETAYVFAQAAAYRAPDLDYLRLSAGADYNFADGLYGLVEYHFNGAGEARPADYGRNYSKAAYTEGADYLLGRHYLAAGFTDQVSPLLSVSCQALINLGDGSLLFSHAFVYSFADNVEVDAGFFLGLGRHPAAEPTGLGYRSEFGAYPKLFYTSIKLYF